MEKIFCDRCGKEINPKDEAEKYMIHDMPFYRIATITYDNKNRKVKTYIDLCFNCQKEVFSWYENRKSNSSS